MDVAINGQQEGSLWWYLDRISVNILVVILFTIVLQNVTIGGNWVMGTWDLSEFFFITACEYIIISK